MMEQTDLRLLAIYASTRDTHAFAEVVRRHTSLIFATCMRILRNDADAQDVTQACFFELAQKPKAPRAESGSVAGYLHAMARSRSLDLLRSQKRRMQQEQSAPASTRDVPVWPDLLPHMDAAIAELKPELQEPLLLHFFEEQTQSDIARKLSVDQTTISRRIEKALDLIRAYLAKAGVTVSAAALAALLMDNAASAIVPESLEPAMIELAISAPRGRIRIVSIPVIGIAVLILILIVVMLLGADVVLPLRKKNAAENKAGPEGMISIARLADLPHGHEGVSYAVAFETIHNFLSPQKTVSYPRVMGLSGMSFITQAMPKHIYDGKVDVGWWPLDSFGFMARTDFLGKATGWQLHRMEQVESEFTADPAAHYRKYFAPIVQNSLTAGRPVLADHDQAFIIIQQRDLSLPLGLCATSPSHKIDAPQGEPPFPWGVLVFGHPMQPLDIKQADVEALQYAVSLAHDKIVVPKPDVLTGQKAWRAWAAILRDTKAPTENRHHANMVLHLQMQRSAAADYLRDVATRFDAPARDHLLKAADLYEELSQELSSTHVGDLENRSEARTQLANLVDQWAKRDAQAIAEIQAAIK